MGKGILIIVLGFLFLTTYEIKNLMSNSNQGLKTSIEFFESAQSRLIANSAVEIYLEKLRRNKTLRGNFTGINLMNGNFDVSISGPDSLLKIEAIGKFGNSIHKSVATAKRSQVSIPPINSSMYVSADNLGLNIAGNVDIDGNDHNLDGSPGTNPAIPGIAVDEPSDSAYIVNNLKPKISNQIIGAGGSPSVRTVNSSTDWLSVTENYIFAADNTLSSGNYSSGAFGTYAEPKITHVTGDVTFSGSASGFGILIVNGNLTLSGNFSFKGLIIAYGQSSITTRLVGNSALLGGVIFVGQSVDLQATGNSSFHYSKQAIDVSKTNIKSSRFEILSWWE